MSSNESDDILNWKPPISVTGKIVEVIDLFNYLFVVDGYETNIHVKLSGKQRRIYILGELVVGEEFVIEISPIDKTRGRLAKRQPGRFKVG